MSRLRPAPALALLVALDRAAALLADRWQIPPPRLRECSFAFVPAGTGLPALAVSRGVAR